MRYAALLGLVLRPRRLSAFGGGGGGTNPPFLLLFAAALSTLVLGARGSDPLSMSVSDLFSRFSFGSLGLSPTTLPVTLEAVALVLGLPPNLGRRGGSAEMGIRSSGLDVDPLRALPSLFRTMSASGLDW